MLGNIMGVAFGGLAPDLGWYVVDFDGVSMNPLTVARRLMLGSTVVLPLIVCAQVYFCPESPRWLVQHGKVDKAFKSFRSTYLFGVYLILSSELKLNFPSPPPHGHPGRERSLLRLC
jgi:hypothetical protein